MKCFWNLFPPTVSTVVLPPHLQMDMNFRVSSTTYLSLNQQSTNGEHYVQLVDYQTQMDHWTNMIVRRNLSRNFLMQVYFLWQPVDSYQIKVINAT